MATPEPTQPRRFRLRKRTSEQIGPPTDVQARDVSLAETLDRVLARGVVANAEVVIAVADIPLVYVGLQALVSSVETARALAIESTHNGAAASAACPADQAAAFPSINGAEQP